MANRVTKILGTFSRAPKDAGADAVATTERADSAITVSALSTAADHVHPAVEEAPLTPVEAAKARAAAAAEAALQAQIAASEAREAAEFEAMATTERARLAEEARRAEATRAAEAAAAAEAAEAAQLAAAAAAAVALEEANAAVRAAEIAAEQAIEDARIAAEEAAVEVAAAERAAAEAAAAERVEAERVAAEAQRVASASSAGHDADRVDVGAGLASAHPADPTDPAPSDVTTFIAVTDRGPESAPVGSESLASGGWMRGLGGGGARAAASDLAARVPGSLAALEGRNISAWFGDHQVLDRVSLTMEAGIVTSLIGPSGCGKSTFLRILNRMHELIPSASLAGEVLLDGDDIYDPTRKLIDARKDIGMVFQKPNPFPAQSIYDNVIAGLKLTGTRATRDEKDELVESCLIKAGLWKEVKDRLRAPGAGLSGGQQQRLCIARSLAVKPRVLLMDEPCSALDPTSTRVIEETMLELVQDVTIVIVTHNMQQAQRVSQQCAFFLASQGTPGAIVEHGDTDAMFADPIDPRTYDYVNGRFG